MSSQSKEKILRIIIATDRTWRVDQFARFLSAVDALVCRVEAAYILGDLLRRWNEELSSLEAMGLLHPGASPRDWSESHQGTEALSRHGYLQVAKALRQYGVNVKSDHLGWQVDFAFEDILQLVPPSQHLEIEYLKIGSPMLSTLSKVGSDAISQAFQYLRLIFLSCCSAEDRRKALEVIRGERDAHAQRLKAQTDTCRAIARQADAKARMWESLSRRMEQQYCANSDSERPLQLDVSGKQESMALQLREGGAPRPQVDQKIIAPLNREIDEIVRAKLGAHITAIFAELVDARDMDENASSFAGHEEEA